MQLLPSANGLLSLASDHNLGPYYAGRNCIVMAKRKQPPVPRLGPGSGVRILFARRSRPAYESRAYIATTYSRYGPYRYGPYGSGMYCYV